MSLALEAIRAEKKRREDQKAKIAGELAFRKAARARLIDFVRYTKPVRTDESGTVFDHGYRTNWHHSVIAEALDRLVIGTCKRLMIFVPPRHGKSELCSVRLPAYALGCRPSTRIIAASYGADLAHEMSRQAQRVIDSDEFKRLFPRVSLNAKNIRTVSGSTLRNVDEWETIDPLAAIRQGGRYKCAGVGGALTGRGFDLGIIDDPVKDRVEADSIVYRDRVWDWYTSVFYTRRSGPNARIVLIQTRWHEDDLAGRLLREAKNGGEQWEVISLPAIAEEKRSVGDPRKTGEALWPDLFDTQNLEIIKRQSSRDWAALYQQRPTLEGGSVFRREWFRAYTKHGPAETMLRTNRVTHTIDGDSRPRVTTEQVDVDWNNLIRYATVDPAFSLREAADFTAAGVWGFDPRRGDLYLLDWFCEQVNSPTLLAALKGKVAAWKIQCVYIEKVGAQLGVIDVFKAAGLPTRELEANRDKLVRAYTASPLVERGVVYWPVYAPWLEHLEHELLTFPLSEHKDQVDAFSYGVIVAQSMAAGERKPYYPTTRR